jgi:MFS family permease
MLLTGIALFSVASALCAFAPGLGLLIAARVVQGMGAALMMSLAMALVSESIPKEKTGSAMGILGTVSALGTALGPSLGGALIDHGGWPMMFLVNTPLGAIAWLLAARFLPINQQFKREARLRFDSVGTLLLTLTLAAYALAMTLGHGHFGQLNVALLLVSGLGLGLFIYSQIKVDPPLIQLSLFLNPTLSIGFAMSALVSTVVMATLVVGPFYLAGALALDTSQVGLTMASGPIVAAVVGTPAGKAVDRLGAQRVVFVGLLVMVVGVALLSLMPAAAGVMGYMAPLMLLTTGYALFQAANNTAVMTHLMAQQRGVGSGLLGLSRNLGLITGASVMGMVFALGVGVSDMASAEPGAVETGMRITFGVASALIVIAVSLSLIGHMRSWAGCGLRR